VGVDDGDGMDIEETFREPLFAQAEDPFAEFGMESAFDPEGAPSPTFQAQQQQQNLTWEQQQQQAAWEAQQQFLILQQQQELLMQQQQGGATMYNQQQQQQQQLAFNQQQGASSPVYNQAGGVATEVQFPQIPMSQPQSPAGSPQHPGYASPAMTSPAPGDVNYPRLIYEVFKTSKASSGRERLRLQEIIEGLTILNPWMQAYEGDEVKKFRQRIRFHLTSKRSFDHKDRLPGESGRGGFWVVVPEFLSDLTD